MKLTKLTRNEFPKIVITWGEAEEDMPPYYMVALYVSTEDCEPDFVTVDVADEHVVFNATSAIEDLCAAAGIDAGDVNIAWDL